MESYIAVKFFLLLEHKWSATVFYCVPTRADISTADILKTTLLLPLDTPDTSHYRYEEK